jgi:hypothetical protein
MKDFVILMVLASVIVFVVHKLQEQDKDFGEQRQATIKADAARLRELGCVPSRKIGHGATAPYTYWVWKCPGVTDEILFLGE